MHSYLEYHIAGQGLLDLTESGVEAKQNGRGSGREGSRGFR
jgi:hypothetical protein